MAIQVFGDSASGNCLKVKWTLDLLNRPYRWEEVDVTSGRTRQADYLALNPVGQVPCVVFDDGRTLAQSNAILIHFTEGSRLIPTDAYERARMMEWLFWEQYSHEPYIAVRRFLIRSLGKDPASLDPKLFERGSAALARLEQALQGADWLCNKSFSLADISLVAYTRMAGDGGFDLGRFPAVRRWIARVEGELGLPAYAIEAVAAEA